MSKFFMSNRRQFIRSASGYMLAIPFLPSLAKAQAVGDVPKRFVAIRTVYGQPPQLFYPGNRPTEQMGPNVYYRALAANQTLSPIINDKFRTISHKLSIMRGIDHSQNGHNRTSMMCPGDHSLAADGKHNSTWSHSFDEVLARSTQMYPQVPQYRSLRIQPALGRYYPDARFSFWNKELLPYETDMLALHSKLFGGFNQGGGTNKIQRQVKVIDLAKDAFDDLSKSRKLSSEDLLNLDQYKDMLNDLGEKANNLSAITCTPPSSVDPSGSYAKAYEVGVDIMILALSCGLTKVACFSAPWFGSFEGENHSAFHGISHWSYSANNLVPDMGHGSERMIYANESPEALRAIRYYAWTAERVARVMTKMDQITETNGKTMLDNSLVYWGNEQGGASGHNRYSLPTVFAGTLDGKVKPGYWDFTKRPFAYDANRTDIFNPAGTIPQATLLTTLASLYGLPPASYEKPGQGGFGDFDLANFNYGYSGGLTASNIYADYVANNTARRKLIPSWLI